jgi:hypothetical protein
MKCYHCEHYDNKTGICDCDGKVVISPESDGECDYLKEKPTVFEKIIASKEALARALCGKVRVACFGVYYSMLTGLYYPDTEKAIADTLKKLEEVS